MVIVNRDAVRDLDLTFDFGVGKSSVVDTGTLHGPEMDAREAHITREPKHGTLKQGKFAVMLSHASGCG